VSIRHFDQVCFSLKNCLDQWLTRQWISLSNEVLEFEKICLDKMTYNALYIYLPLFIVIVCLSMFTHSYVQDIDINNINTRIYNSWSLKKYIFKFVKQKYTYEASYRVRTTNGQKQSSIFIIIVECHVSLPIQMSPFLLTFTTGYCKK
jgi:hypothetical protein